MDTENIDRLFLELSQFTQATTGKELLLKKQITSQQSTITALVEALKGSRVALEEMANVLRPTLPSLADNVIGAHLRTIDSALSKAQREGEG